MKGAQNRGAFFVYFFMHMSLTISENFHILKYNDAIFSCELLNDAIYCIFAGIKYVVLKSTEMYVMLDKNAYSTIVKQIHFNGYVCRNARMGKNEQ